MAIQKGNFYNTLTANRKDDDVLKACIEETVTKLMESDISSKKPGILLGKVQSGKTRTFLGVMALAFDNGYDIAIILTKGTKPLTEQTLKRLHEDFGQFEEDNKAQVHDIMFFPKNMVPYELSQKLIIVAKKETNNLKRVLNDLTNTYPDLKNKKILIIDDEADFASISFHKEKESGLIGGLFAWYCRPDLKKKMIVSAFIFLLLYFFYFLTLIAMYPGYVEQVWNLAAISGILIFGIPLEELLFALSFGFLWSSIYEHIRWRKVA